MAAVVVPHAPFRHRSPTPPSSLSGGLTIDTSKFKSPIPNKHIPYCSPGPAPSIGIQTPATPPASPVSKHLDLRTSSILQPPDAYAKIVDAPPVYSIDASTLAKALEQIATQLLPDPKHVFPWLHGLHPENQIQLAFFVARRKALRKLPKCIRGITIVKAGGELSKSRLKGSVSPNELLSPVSSKDPVLFDIDPKEGFSVRNFHIQSCKLATLSDIVVYGDDNQRPDDVRKVAVKFARAQKSYRERCGTVGIDLPLFNTFVVHSKHSSIPKTTMRSPYFDQSNDFLQVLSAPLNAIMPTL